MEQVMGTCLDRGIKVVSNAGGLDPDSCAEAVAEVAARLGLSPRIAFVTGDDVLARLDDLGAHLAHLETGEPILDGAGIISANAYLGCWGIVEALSRGADIVITGRTTDAAVVCGPAAWHHGWRRDDWDALAGGVVAGHLIECGTQVTGGNYSFFDEVPGLEWPGFPWAEIAADGSAVIGKHDGSGGQVSIGTVTSQLLYEISGPRYLGPDVTARFDTVELEEVARDRVRVSGARGEPPPPTLKVAMNEIGGYRNEVAVALTGLDIEAKARLVEEAFWRACPVAREDFDSVSVTLSRTDHADPLSNDEAIALWRVCVKDGDEHKVGRAFSNAAIELALASVPGFFVPGGGPTEGRPYGVHRPATVPAHLVPQQVVVFGEGTTVVESSAPEGRTGAPPVESPAGSFPTGPFARVPLGRVVGARSGDKGGNANLGVFARCDEAWAWLDWFLTVERVRELLPETTPLTIHRHRLPLVRALNFVIEGLLQEGVAASTRYDAQAKGLGEWLRARVVEVPARLLP
jgi:hypothetical protein